MNRKKGRIQDSSVGSDNLRWGGGHYPPTRVLFGKNVCKMKELRVAGAESARRKLLHVDFVKD